MEIEKERKREAWRLAQQCLSSLTSNCLLRLVCFLSALNPDSLSDGASPKQRLVSLLLTFICAVGTCAEGRNVHLESFGICNLIFIAISLTIRLTNSWNTLSMGQW